MVENLPLRQQLAALRREVRRPRFSWFWTWKSRRVGRPPLLEDLMQLIEKLARDNPPWSRRRIANELAKLGHALSKDTVAKYMPKPPKRSPRPASQT
jgi:hypothetical protein